MQGSKESYWKIILEILPRYQEEIEKRLIISGPVQSQLQRTTETIWETL